MIVGLGLDLVEIDRIRQMYLRHGARFTGRILTEAERAYVMLHKDPSERLAGRWAAKEAAMKALGTGVGDGVGWKGCEILPDERGKPCLYLHGAARELANTMGADICHVTITHCGNMAAAQVILEKSCHG